MVSQPTLSKVFAGIAIAGLLIGSASVFFVGPPSTKPSAVKSPTATPVTVLPTVVPSPTRTVKPSPTPSKKVKPSATAASPSAKPSTTKPSSGPTTAPPRPKPTLTRSPAPKPPTTPPAPKPTPKPTTPSPTPTTPKPTTPPPVVNQVTRVYQLINQERQKRGLGIIYRTDALEASANRWSVQMANEGRMYHNNPLPPGVYGECVARGYSTGDAVMAAWMNSTGHRNIILGNYSQVGVGYVAVGGWWTLQFA